ncbi:MAG: SIS domain-containing protein [Desulfobacterales bacterium]|nr:SIS domain-containing protein [Desulfobacterales bacterium]
MTNYLEKLMADYPAISPLQADIQKAADILISCHQTGNKIFTCGNGGSAADAEHMVGELMKGFRSKRALSSSQVREIAKTYPDEASEIARNLQQAIPAISLVSNISLSTAFSNDVNPEYVFAQQIFGLGRPGDVLVALSTSGNSKNVVQAAKVAKAMGIHVIGMTGQSGGELQHHCVATIKAPSSDTARIQELQLPIYHCLCSMIEEAVFP